MTNLREQYDRDGYAICRHVLDADLVAEASAHVDWLLEKNPGLRPEQLHNNLMTHDPFWVRLVADDRLLDVAEQFIGPDIALFASHYISKPPGDGQPVLWHQDGSYWPLEPMDVVTLWLAVDESDVDNGCMRVIPGSQSTQLQPMHRNEEVANVLSSSMDPEFVDDAQAVDVVLEAGDVSIHHPNIVHGSNANQSPRRRCGLTIRYIPATTRILSEGQWPSAFLLRGQATADVNDYLPWPQFEAGQHMPFRGSDSWPPDSDTIS
ncbi:MAG: phytanoyl-CoA dioxygenase family protein [Gemmatimonadetes bacterium]|nr:phytanoyl-CoA dioxygenase family protein [Gemmatimonadota bacterium]MBT7860021.1 phytanoyl-CoA dioxygenase family protein [Gemmatimonadota bacterium]